jgi:hypothetical protein
MKNGVFWVVTPCGLLDVLAQNDVLVDLRVSRTEDRRSGDEK